MTLKMFVLDDGGERFWYAAYAEHDVLQWHEDMYGWDEVAIDGIVEAPPDALHAVGGDIDPEDVPPGGAWDASSRRAVATTEQWLASIDMRQQKVIQLWSTLF